MYVYVSNAVRTYICSTVCAYVYVRVTVSYQTMVNNSFHAQMKHILAPLQDLIPTVTFVT